MAKNKPVRIPDQVTARELLARTPLVSRRSLRRRGGYVVWQNQEVSLDAPLAVTTEWSEARYVHWTLRWRLAAPPVVLLHKPVGIVTSRKEDGGHPTVFQVLRDHPLVEELEPVGRLDVETSGTLLFTDDGELLHRLTHPRRQIERRYRATLEGEPTEENLTLLRNGEVELRDGHKPFPLRVAPWDGDPAQGWEVVLIEGKYHEVRRMFAAIGTPVVGLHRAMHANLSCDAPAMEPGTWRELTAEERDALYARVQLAPPGLGLQVLWTKDEGAPDTLDED